MLMTIHSDYIYEYGEEYKAECYDPKFPNHVTDPGFFDASPEAWNEMMYAMNPEEDATSAPYLLLMRGVSARAQLAGESNPLVTGSSIRFEKLN